MNQETPNVSGDAAAEIRNAIVDKLVATGMITSGLVGAAFRAVASKPVEAAFRTVPRHPFAPELRPGVAGIAAAHDTLGVAGWVNAAVPAGQPSRALWDAVGAAVLRDELVRQRWQREPSLAELLTESAPAGQNPLGRLYSTSPMICLSPG